MIYMLSAFNLRDGENFNDFQIAYEKFVKVAKEAGIIEDATPIGMRVSNTPMDTDAGRIQKYFSTMYFRDRTQLDQSYAKLEAQIEPDHTVHLDMYRRAKDSVFTCWEDGS